MKRFFAKYKIDEPIAVAVSGGADSLALALRLKEAGKQIIALTVDHGLRSESSDEACYVAEVMQKKGIEHQTLVWRGEKPQKGVEEAAREARYKLMFAFCREHNIRFLATGHHRRDQAETFLLRLQRGSGVFGLSGILPISEREGITIIRPQLEDDPEDLKAFLRAEGVKWIEDPMNNDEDFLRVKVRHFLPELARIGIDEKRLSDTAITLAKTRSFLQSLADEFVQNYVRWWGGVAVSLPWQKLQSLHIEVALPVLGQLVRQIGGGVYPPEAVEIQRVLSEGHDFKGCTLGKCELFIAAKRLWIVLQDEENSLLSRAEWDAFVLQNPKYRNAGLPYKVRRALKNNLKE